MKTLLIDDELNGREVLEQLLKQYCKSVTIAGSANSIITGIQKINELKPELVFLDIQMPGGTGFDILKQVKNIDFEVIFVTAHDQYAIKAFKCSAVDYLLKPINIDELKNAVSNAEKKLLSKQEDLRIGFLLNQIDRTKSKWSLDKIILPILNGYEILDAADITYCKSEANYTRFYFKDGSNKLASKTMKEFDEILAGNNFFRAHRSYMVNLNFVSKYLRGKGGTLIMKDGIEITVASERKDELIKLMFGTDEGKTK